MFLTTVGVGALLARVGRERVFVVIPAAISVAALFARAAVEAEATWVYGALWILQALPRSPAYSRSGGSPVVSDTRRAKRFFPLIAAGGVVGLIVGGLAAGPLAATVGSENLLLVWAAVGRCGGRGVAARLHTAADRQRHVHGAGGRAFSPPSPTLRASPHAG